MSPAQIPVASGATRISPAPGRGVSHSPTISSNGAFMMTARMVMSPVIHIIYNYGFSPIRFAKIASIFSGAPT
jgi:hypothetical protein